MGHPLEPRLAAYIAGKLPDATGVAVSALERISGGASRETYRFLLSWTEGGAERRHLLLPRPAALAAQPLDERGVLREEVVARQRRGLVRGPARSGRHPGHCRDFAAARP